MTNNLRVYSERMASLLSVESKDIQGRVTTDGHHPPHQVTGLAVRINNTSYNGYKTSENGESK